MVEIAVPPEGGPPPHIHHHHEDESFYVCQGDLTILAGERTYRVGPGDFVHVPKGTVHCFKNIGKTKAVMVVTFTPAGMEKFFEEAFYPATDRTAGAGMLTEELMQRMMVAASKVGLEFAR